MRRPGPQPDELPTVSNQRTAALDPAPDGAPSRRRHDFTIGIVGGAASGHDPIQEDAMTHGQFYRSAVG
jgi:hypothetical protein